MLLNYLKIAVRNLSKNRAYSAINVVGLAVGLAACLLLALYVRDELSYDRHHAKADRIYRLAQHIHWSDNQIDAATTSGPFATTLKNDFPEIEQTVRFVTEGADYLKTGNQLVKTNLVFADPTYFDVFSHRFLAGNPKQALTKPNSMVLTQQTAENLFGDATKALGRTVEFINGPAQTVTGVIENVPSQSHFTFGAIGSLNPNLEGLNDWQQGFLYTYLLLAESHNSDQLAAKFPAFYKRHLSKEIGPGADFRLELQPLTSIHLHSHLLAEIGPNADSRYVYLFGVVAVIILLLACINYVNLTTAQSTKRTKEIGIRKVVGSLRWQVAVQFFMESALLVIVSVGLGLVLVEAALPLVNQLTDKALVSPLQGQWAVLGIIGALALLAILFSGIYPALYLSSFQPVTVLKGNTSAKAGNGLFRRTLVVTQFAVSVLLIVATLIVYAQMNYVANKPLGFTNDPVVGVRIPDQRVRQQLATMKAELKLNHNVQQVGVTTNPLGRNDLGQGGVILEQNGVKSSHTDMTHILGIDADYLPTMQLTLKAGRNFSPSFPADSTRSVIVNEALVRKAGWQNPIGKRIWFLPNEGVSPEPVLVVGVVKDFHLASMHKTIEPLVFQLIKKPESDNVFIRIKPDNIPATMAHIERVFKQFDPVNVCETYFLNENFARQYQADQQRGQLFMVSAGLAIVIACLGLLGLSAFTASQRTKEIGVRKVLGASVTSIVTLLSKDFLKLVLIAIVIATPVAWWAMNKWLEDFAYKIDIAWWMFALAGLLAISIAVFTVSVQSIKAALMNPVKSLRTE